MRRALLVAYYFPPLGGIGSLRMTGFASHLPRFGWEVTVLAPSNGAYYRDPELHFPEACVVRTPTLELSRIGKRLLRSGGDDVRPADVGGMRAAIRTFARTALYFPDAQIGWCAPALLTARRRLKGRPFDLIFSSSFPITAHLIGRRLHRWLRIPWVAEFRDPWSEMLAPGSRMHARAARLERVLTDEAAGLVMTSPSWAAHHSRLWAREVTMIPNGHDGFPSLVHDNGRFTLAYLGSFYPATQRLTAVWDAVERLNRGGGPRVDRLLFVGELHPALRRVLADRGLEPLVEVTGFLPHRQALSALSGASALLLAGPSGTAETLRGQLAAKIPEYLASGLPIIYVGSTDCDAADLLRDRAGCHVIATDDTEGVVRALHASRNGPDVRDVASLSRAALSGRLAEVFDSALEGGEVRTS